MCGSGVAIYAKSSIQCKLYLSTILQTFTPEVIWLQLRPICLPRPLSSILIGVIYHLPQASTDDNNKLYEYIQNKDDLYLYDHQNSLICSG